MTRVDPPDCGCGDCDAGTSHLCCTPECECDCHNEKGS